MLDDKYKNENDIEEKKPGLLKKVANAILPKSMVNNFSKSVENFKQGNKKRGFLEAAKGVGKGLLFGAAIAVAAMIAGPVIGLFAPIIGGTIAALATVGAVGGAYAALKRRSDKTFNKHQNEANTAQNKSTQGENQSKQSAKSKGKGMSKKKILGIGAAAAIIGLLLGGPVFALIAGVLSIGGCATKKYMDNRKNNKNKTDNITNTSDNTSQQKDNNISQSKGYEIKLNQTKKKARNTVQNKSFAKDELEKSLKKSAQRGRANSIG